MRRARRRSSWDRRRRSIERAGVDLSLHQVAPICAGPCRQSPAAPGRPRASHHGTTDPGGCPILNRQCRRPVPAARNLGPTAPSGSDSTRRARPRGGPSRTLGGIRMAAGAVAGGRRLGAYPFTDFEAVPMRVAGASVSHRHRRASPGVSSALRYLRSHWPDH